MAKARIKRAVYIIKSADAVKVGMSNRPESRLPGLSTGNQHPLTLEYEAWFSHEKAEKVERFCHEMLAEKRLEGEWFSASVKEAIYAIQASSRIYDINEKNPAIKWRTETVHLEKNVYVDRPVEKIVHIPVREFGPPYILMSLMSGMSLSTGFFALGLYVELFNLSDGSSKFFPLYVLTYGMIFLGFLAWVGIGIDAWLAFARRHIATFRTWRSSRTA